MPERYGKKTYIFEGTRADKSRDLQTSRVQLDDSDVSKISNNIEYFTHTNIGYSSMIDNIGSDLCNSNMYTLVDVSAELGKRALAPNQCVFIPVPKHLHP